MNAEIKKCPMCAEQIPLEATICTYCGAKFVVAITGYCANCHAIREADQNGCCKACNGEIIDRRVESKLLDASTQAKPVRQVEMPPKPVSPIQRQTSHKRSFAAIGIIAALIILCGGLFLVARSLLPIRPAALPATPTATITQTPTPIPSKTPRPTRTPTPAPIEISFDNIGDYETGERVILAGQLILFGSTHCDTDCGMLLANPSNTSQEITIFVTLGESRENTLPNQMRPLPDPYTKKDIQVRLDDGTYAGIGSRVIVTGRICETTDGDVCIHDIIKIEAWK